MKFVFMIGDGAVGKMTVGQALTKITPLRLFHNHMMIEPVLEIFGQWRPDVTQRLRQVIFEEFAKGGALPPRLAVWVPNLIFLVIAIRLYRKAPK